ncbi:hypothetical protein [Sphingobacterium allocomposti]|uniref:hypothetical protein n=1 Tax=Sphingobacterium allocomposti TaxID=415956 RepID=UPI0011E61B77|nr:hypothetical protein [Sphingobacterium composti Yoo et al. 2007 non Ten et al. 2007]
MGKTLQQIKDEVAEGFGYKSNSVFNAYEQLLINPHGLTYKVLNASVNQVAIRYANEQNRELVEMLEIINEGINTMDFTQLEGLHNEIESLINKHKQS